ncbi:MAG: phosphotransferase [Bacteroidota bacterium]|jgi:aminoglycoside/choline kinase family phosphotransferase
MSTSSNQIITDLYTEVFGKSSVSIEKIPQSGSDRSYFKVKGDGENCVATVGNNIKENQAFIHFARHFINAGAPVPKVLAVSEDCSVYLQQDFGDISLLQVLESEGYTDHVYMLFKRSLQALAHLQVQGHKQLNYEWCITSKEFGKQAIMADLLYFKYYFLDTLQIPYDKEKLIDDFEVLSIYLARADHRYFMYRDFQSRNILIQDEEVRFIDFQGGMKGAVQYDVASLLWQAKANLPAEWKQHLLDYYVEELEKQLEENVDRTRFIGQYYGYVLLRLLQVLGAYGFRGLFERKAHFLTSIPLALRNVRSFLQQHHVGISVPEFERLLNIVVAEEIVGRFDPDRATPETPLIVEINSFSYKTNGIPKDESEHGGGFVFDCRSIFNPGRFEAYKTLTGRDKEVKDFLEQKSKMPQFLNSVFSIVDIAVEDYMQRKFERLQVSFGCTGGQHRSVYAADALARHLKNKYGVKIELQHLVQDAKNWVN